MDELKNDPWIHRSKGMVCNTCMWCATKAPWTEETPENKRLGRCRRHSPTMNGYPVVYVMTDWCGDHKLDENKV